MSQVNEIAGGSLVLPISAANKIGLDPILNYMVEGKTIVFLGSSGVGKSTLLNSLLEQEVQTTNQTSNYSGKGKHTTTHRQLFFHHSGCMIVDTPGMKELQLWAENGDLDSVFTDVVDIVAQCKFSNCTHRTEPDCALQSAIDSGVISRERYERYLTQLKELSRLKEKKKEYMQKYSKRSKR
ncbi:ribosome small subunit-dependent GTPase A [Paenibacillus sp. N3/727]|uniref:ribosome small subunit-dependent GTPase A n=1 Tax=Paenibacillus sp. N3/727 TaxID=2925845 RepID=UPI001F52E2B2|nr:ribosome small subunit-dependent GTPase A [Paenibacillus sp. N3/727]UNK19408.1 ribosome small subunit-dependent GTPase A [Paenibacillus sp. N3/727]